MHSNLVSLCPTLIGMLRRADANVADLLLNDVDKDEVKEALEELNDAILGEKHLLTMTQVRYTYNHYDDEVWAQGLNDIFKRANPRVVSSDIAKRLLHAYSEKGDSLKNPEEAGGTLGPILDDMPRTFFQALGEYCALIRDTATDKSAVIAKVAQGVMGVKDDNVVPLMELLVTNAEPLFGRVAAVRTRVLYEADLNVEV